MVIGPELVVLLGPDGAAVGTAPKAEVHHARTPLHLAFSCYLVDDDGRLLLTRRAATKRTFPGVWTNSFCGHPGPGEALDDAVRRRGRQELGVDVGMPRLVLPAFRYRAEQDGVVEHEICPVFVAPVSGTPTPDPAEVDDVRRVTWADLVAAARGGGRPELSPWCVAQVAELVALGDGPAAWPAADPAMLPLAAHLAAAA
ncbi:isopentenyl-diphosphate Delta-isomerase [Actinomycetospora endophytica]|uniref:Isopentenyl-diphosphate Delta-isomerase n=1 Tax=Actinomycetospora endophytica TaxID=2291215 RepID=A0ABS8P1X5_9PSEU|nr:isopentenyl-diphosphate Delta-isomerase [Actinomycetospora endophytica]MCD2192248.1 isopentenyl-diphosphate Delta-isomerase [Actinomycetospora endophytica]